MKKEFIRNDIKFVRYGNLSSIKHKKYIKNKLNNTYPDDESWDDNVGYHSPPARRGIYAFVYPYVDKFLLTGPSFSGIKSTHPKITYVRCSKGNKIFYDYSNDGDKANEFGYYNLDRLKDQSQIEDFKKCLNKEKFLSKDYSFDKVKNDLHVLTKRVKPKIFSYKGEIWHHLENYLPSKGSIIERKGAWVKTDFLDYKKALHKVLGKMNQNNRKTWKYSWDCLEVFIEKLK